MTSSKKRYTQDLELDARLVLAAVHGGFEGFAAVAMSRQDIFAGPDEAVARADWLKRQPAAYIEAVSARAAALEAAVMTPDRSIAAPEKRA